MLYRENEEYKLIPYIATYTQNEQQHEQHVASKAEMEAFEKMGHISDLTFNDAVYDEDVEKRLDEVKDYPENEFNTVHEYVLNNNVLEGTSLSTKKQNDLLEQSILDLSMFMMGGM